LTGLVKQIDETVDAVSSKRPEGQKLGVFLIISDPNSCAEHLAGLAKKESLKRVSLCIGTAPPRYEVNKEADVTVVIYTVGRPGRQEVTSNFAVRKGELCETTRDDIVAALSKVLPK
jgi:hypothetical protein